MAQQGARGQALRLDQGRLIVEPICCIYYKREFVCSCVYVCVSVQCVRLLVEKHHTYILLNRLNASGVLLQAHQALLRQLCHTMKSAFMYE